MRGISADKLISPRPAFRGVLTLAAAVSILCSLGCHREGEFVPLSTQKIAIQDRFYDVAAVGPERAIIIGYGGKILLTEDGGSSWSRIPSGTEDHALYSIAFADKDTAWIAGQDGLILKSSDGGKSWELQNSGTARHLFGVMALDRNRAWAVGDRSTLTVTTDGGKTWTARQIKTGEDLTGGISIAAQDPVYYDVRFVDAMRGWISGEFGKLLHTTDGGQTWVEQQQGLMGDEFFDVLDLPTMFGMSFKNAQEGVAVGIDARIARTANGGATWAWEDVQSPYPLQDPFFAAHMFQDGSGWAIGAAGQVVHRAAGAQAWELADLGQPLFTWLRGISFFDDQNGWLVGGYGLILHTTDAGKTWIPCFG